MGASRKAHGHEKGTDREQTKPMTAPSTKSDSLPLISPGRRWWVLGAGLLSALAGAAAVYWLVMPPADPPGKDEEARPPDGPAWFQDVTAASGVAFTCPNGEEAGQFTILESLGGGVAVFDYDGDGRLDLYFAGG